jgi:hypothetical protein
MSLAVIRQHYEGSPKGLLIFLVALPISMELVPGIIEDWN